VALANESRVGYNHLSAAWGAENAILANAVFANRKMIERIDQEPPTVAVIDGGAEVRLGGKAKWRIKWSQVRKIAIRVAVNEQLEYSEAFWQLEGEGAELFCPVDLVVGAEAFKAVLFAFQGFNQAEYKRAIKAEAEGRPGHFVCWQAATV